MDSPPRDRTCVSCGSRIAGRFFSAEPLGKAPQLMYRMANSYLFYFTIFDTSLSSIPFVENFLLNSLKSGFAFITSSRSSLFIKMQPLFSYIQNIFFNARYNLSHCFFFFFFFHEAFWTLTSLETFIFHPLSFWQLFFTCSIFFSFSVLIISLELILKVFLS